MRSYSAGGVFIPTCLALIIFLISCSPKCVVRGQVVDAETHQPIKGAAVAIRWYTDNSVQESTDSRTVAAVQALADDKGVFEIPKYSDKKYVLGVYKNGYICWSSRDIFLLDADIHTSDTYRPIKNHPLKDDMQIDLRPLKNIRLRTLHAGFTVMVAGEATDTDSGPFHEAIQSEYKLWREGLRKDFQKQLGVR